MAIYHIVLFKLKSGVTAEQISDLKREGHAMVGLIPGLQKVEFGPPLPATSHRSKGYDFGFVAVLDKAEDVIVYGDHPAHLKVHKLREALCDDSQGILAYDLEFPA